MRDPNKARGLGVTLAGAIAVTATVATLAVAVASARVESPGRDPRVEGYQPNGRLWVRAGNGAPRPVAVASPRDGYRRQGRLWIGGRAHHAPGGGPDLVLSKTVGTDPNVCATTSNLGVPTGTDVTYCYEVTNASNVTFVVHDLTDDQLGTILSAFPFDLAPGASVFVTATANITTATTNVGTWTATDGAGAPTQAQSTATVTILQPSIAFTKTVGTDPNVCATTDAIQVPMGTDVTYCYEVTNTGAVTLTLHDLSDDQLGTILNDFNFVFAPGASVFVTQSANVTVDVTNTATWTAFNPGPVDQTSEMDTAMVTIDPIPVELESFRVD